MNTKTVLLFGSAILILTVAVFLAFSLTINRGKPGAATSPANGGAYAPTSGGVPTSGSAGGGLESPASVSKTRGSVTATLLPDGNYLLEDKSGGYRITVAPDWMLSEEDAGIRLYYGDPNNLKSGSELENVAILSIGVMDNGKQYGFDDWFKNLDAFTAGVVGAESNYKNVRINDGPAFRSSRKSDTIDDYGKIVPRDNSSVVDYLVFRDTKVYRVSCAVSGSDYENLVGICEDQIKNFSVK